MSENIKLITFVVPCYNSQEYMHVCIESLLHAKDTCEIVIIDDGSKDRTGEIADAYAEKYPETVRVIHQPNGGHGAGINSGLAVANGLYFKVVDSDDWADKTALEQVVDTLQELEKDGGVDLMVCNYVYEHTHTGYQKTIRFGNALPEGRVLAWKDTKRFRIDQQLSLHSCIYRTETIRKSGLKLPEHVFYEDNLFVYTPLPYVERLYYLDADFYRYYIGREGQSVSPEGILRHAVDQRLIATRIFAAHDIDEIRKRDRVLARYMHHSMSFMLILAVIFTRLHNSKEADALVKEFWDGLIEVNPKKGRKMRVFSRAGVLILSMPGPVGRLLCRFFFWVSHKVVRFN
ncbi:MAG: glycosyltransferase [Clostridia bacterium]|nr:glycosyltransferase [Clostridia bacterium]